MTKNAQQIALAKLDEWTPVDAYAHSITWFGKWREGEQNPYETTTTLPNYDSRDVLVELISKQDEMMIWQINYWVADKAYPKPPILASVELLREGLLRKTGLWKDE